MNIFEKLQHDKTPEKLHEEEMVRQTLEAVAQRLLRENCNATYRQAMVRAAKIIRSMKP
jgi:hypothetical protein